MVVALKPLHDAARVTRVVVSTYQATSGAGVQGQEDSIGGARAELCHDQGGGRTGEAAGLCPQCLFCT